MTVSFASRLVVPADVLVQELDGEIALLDLRSSNYFGLNESGSAIWHAVTRSESIERAFEELLTEYDVEPSHLKEELEVLLEKLLARGLLQVAR